MNSIRYGILTGLFIVLALTTGAWADVTVTATQEWAVKFDGQESLAEKAKAVAVDSDGNVVVAGQGDATGVFAFVTVKYDQDGIELWRAVYDGLFASAIAIDGDGNVYVCGAGMNSQGDREYVTIKYAPDGAEQWVQTYTGGFILNYGVAIGQYLDGDDGKVYVYVTGYSGSFSSWDYATVKYDATDGTEIWAARYEGPDGNSATATAMVVDSAGNVHVTGNSIGSEETLHDYVTVKYDKTGAQQWAAVRTGPTGYWDKPVAIGVDSMGNVAVTGYTQVLGGNPDFLTALYNAAGVLQWDRVYNGPEADSSDYTYGLAVDSAGNVIVTGSSSDDFATIKYGSDGSEQWVARYAGPDNAVEWSPFVALDGDDNVYVAGSSAPSGSNDYDYTTVMYNPGGVQQWVSAYDGGENGTDNPVAMAVYTDAGDQTTYVVVTGESELPLTRMDFATVKFDATGTQAWSARYNSTGSSDSEATDLAVDSAGNVYVTGYTDTSLNNTNFLTAKYNPDGLELWTREYDGTPGDETNDQAVAIAVDGVGNVYVTGSIDVSPYDNGLTVKYDTNGNQLEAVVFDSGRTDRPLDIVLFVDADDGRTYLYVGANDLGLSHYTVIKYDADLVEQWVRTYTYTSGSGKLTALAVDPDGNVYLTGASETVAGFDAYATVKFDKNGEEIWDMGHNLDSQDDEAQAIAVDGTGNVYVTGRAVYRTEWVNNQYQTSSDCITIKYNAGGLEQWVARYDHNVSSDICGHIAVDGQGNVYVAGDSNSGVTYDPDYAIIKYDAAGQEQWASRWDGGYSYRDYMRAMTIDGAGNVYVSGHSATSYADNSDYATIAYDSDGNELWLQRYNDSADGPAVGQRNVPAALTVKDDGHVYVTGLSVGPTSGWDFATVKYSQETVITDTDAPLISATTPEDQAVDTPVTGLVTATFNEAMDRISIENAATFTVTDTVAGTLVDGAVAYDEGTLTARFTPTEDFAFGSQFTARISTAATDLSGNALAQERVWQFTTLSEPDTTPPQVDGTTPADATSGVAINALITGHFNEAMDPATITAITFTLVDNSTGSPVLGSVGYDTGTRTARFDLASSLAFGTSYTVTLTTGVADIAGNSLANAYVWNFSTGSEPDTTSPTVITVSPLDGASDVDINLSAVRATFNEPMDGASINNASFTLQNLDSGAAVTAGTVSYAAGTARLSLGSALVYDTSYVATIAAGVSDIAGNLLGTDHVWTFRTAAAPPPDDATLPRVVSTTPVSGAGNVPASAGVVTATFTEPVEGLDENSFVISSGGSNVAGTVSYDVAGMTVRFESDSAFSFVTSYTVTIVSTLVSDLAGNNLAQDYVWTFTIGGDPALGGCEPELGQEEGCENFDYFTYGTGVEVNTYGSSIAGFTAEDAARKSVSFEESLSEAAVDTDSFESQAIAQVDDTHFSLRSRSKRMEPSSDRAGAWSIGASKIEVTGVPPGTVIPMSMVVSGNFIGPTGTLLLQVRDFDNYRMLGSVSVLSSGTPFTVNGQTFEAVTYNQLIDPYGNLDDASNYLRTTANGGGGYRLDFLYPAVANNGIYVWFVAGVNATDDTLNDETDFTASLEILPPPGVTVTLASGQVFSGPADTDGDGVSDLEDSSPNNAAIASPVAATGNGNITVDVSGTAGASLSQIRVLDDDDLSLNQDGKPSDQQFPDGLVSFRLNGLEPGASAQVNLTFPSDLPADTRYYKVNQSGFFEYTNISIDGNTVTLNLVDGGSGDSDGIANGVIIDPGGISFTVADDDGGGDGGGGSGCFVNLLNFKY
jgi:uncharacterized delta-60 repeat protein